MLVSMVNRLLRSSIAVRVWRPTLVRIKHMFCFLFHTKVFRSEAINDYARAARKICYEIVFLLYLSLELKESVVAVVMQM